MEPNNTNTVHETIERSPADWQRIPAELRQRPQWVLAGPDKSPRTVNGAHASSTDPTTWASFDAVCAAAKPEQFIGYMLSADDPFACIDLDVKDDMPPERMELYQNIVSTLGSYSEFSRSGRGMHVWVRANIGPGCKRDGVEVYSQERFIICTGNVYIDRPIEDRQDIVANMVSQMRGPEHSTQPLEDQPQVEADEVVIERAMRAANADKFISLARGEWRGKPEYPSQSEADLALISILAFYSRNNDQVKRIFRLTELGKREKAIKNDRYLNLTLGKVRGRQATEKAQYEAVAAGMKPRIDALLRQEMRYQFRQIGEGEIDVKALHPPTMDLATMLSSLVLISAEKTLVAFRDRPAISIGPGGMGTLLSHNLVKVETPQGQVRWKPTFDVWLQDPKKITAYKITFDPRAGEFCNSPDQRLALNLWRPRPHTTPHDWQERVKPFRDHVAYLIPVPEECQRFLDWLAHIEQVPGELPHAHYLMIATSQGVGRGWLSSLLACVWAGHVALDFDLKQSLNSGFNGQLSRKLLAVVDEINEGGMNERWQHSEKLKSMVTTTERFINVKYGLQQSEVNCCRFLLNSNYESALPLHVGDRRWNVIRNPSDPLPSDYYKKLYWLINPRNPESSLFVASVREALRQRDLSKFNPGERAVMNEAKEAVVAASMTTEDEKAAELARNYPQAVITAEHLFHYLFGFAPQNGGDDTSRKWKLLAPIAAKAGIEKLKEFVWKSHRYKTWALRNPQRWKQARPDELARELQLEF
ncbi:MAG TPA: DUF5906 domain-containing protein [Steroidobacteraceae bacterium]|nr:DUF5906 domain-containing protein [Steroidobacteraceae bacterium]